MTTLTLQQASEACQTNKTAWLNRKAELTAAEQEYQELLLDDNASGFRRLQSLRDLIDVKKWEVNQAAGRYIFSHEEVQRISIHNRLHDFMQQNGAGLTAALAPELMGIKNQPAMIKNRALDRSVSYLREALSVWLTAGNDINYSAQDSDILTAIGYRPDAPSRDDNREKFTPALPACASRCAVWIHLCTCIKSALLSGQAWRGEHCALTNTLFIIINYLF